MKRTAIAAAAIVGVAAFGATEKTAFTVDFESPYTLAGDSNWSNTTDNAVIVTDQTKNSQVLSIDSSDEVRYTPAVADQTSKVSLDVYLTPGTAAPENVPQDAKLVIYLDVSGDLKGCVDGSTWETIASHVDGNTWTNLTMTFSAGSVTVKMADGTQKIFENSGVPATVKSVGFQGTGFVDNFVGSYSKEYGYASDDSTAGSEISGATIEVNDSTKAVSFDYTGTAAAGTVKFVRIYDDQNNYVTVRVSGNSAENVNASKLPGTITKVVAYYGESVSNVDGSTPTTPTSAAVTDETGTPKVDVTVNGKSGVYYTLVQPDGTVISDSVLVPPEKDNDPIKLTAPVSKEAWGTVKFKVKATDTSLTNGN